MRPRPMVVVTSVLGVLAFVFAIVAFERWGNDYRSAALECCSPSAATCSAARENLIWAVAGSDTSMWPTMSAVGLCMTFFVLISMQYHDGTKFTQRLFGQTNASPAMATTVKSLLVTAAGMILVLLSYALGNTSRPLAALWAAAGCDTAPFPTAGRDWAAAALLCWCGSCFTGHYIRVKQRSGDDVLELRTRGPYKWVLMVTALLFAAATALAIAYITIDIGDNAGYTAVIAKCCPDAAGGVPVVECAAAKTQLAASLFDDNLSARKTSIAAMATSGLLLIGFIAAVYFASVKLSTGAPGLPREIWRHVFAGGALVTVVVIVLLTHAWGATAGKSAHALWTAAQCPGSLPTAGGVLLTALIFTLVATVLGHALVSPLRLPDASARAPLMMRHS